MNGSIIFIVCICIFIFIIIGITIYIGLSPNTMRPDSIKYQLPITATNQFGSATKVFLLEVV